MDGIPQGIIYTKDGKSFFREIHGCELSDKIKEINYKLNRNIIYFINSLKDMYVLNKFVIRIDKLSDDELKTEVASLFVSHFQ
jgi:hypothetical protein